MNLFFGSVLATISLTVPVVTLIAFATGNELQFALRARDDRDGGITVAVSDFCSRRDAPTC
jgi:Ca2+/H+ antiporter